MGLTQALGTPSTVGEQPFLAGFDLMLWGLYAAQVVLAASYVWLLALTAMWFTRPAKAEERPG